MKKYAKEEKTKVKPTQDYSSESPSPGGTKYKVKKKRKKGGEIKVEPLVKKIGKRGEARVKDIEVTPPLDSAVPPTKDTHSDVYRQGPAYEKQLRKDIADYDRQQGGGSIETERTQKETGGIEQKVGSFDHNKQYDITETPSDDGSLNWYARFNGLKDKFTIVRPTTEGVGLDSFLMGYLEIPTDDSIGQEYVIQLAEDFQLVLESKSIECSIYEILTIASRHRIKNGRVWFEHDNVLSFVPNPPDSLYVLAAHLQHRRESPTPRFRKDN